MHLPVKLIKAFFVITIIICGATDTSICAPYLFFEDKSYSESHPSLYPQGSTRNVIPLSGNWRVKLPNDASANVYVPSSYTFEDKVTYETQIFLHDSLENHQFKLLCDGINNQCRILINDQFVHFQGVSKSRFIAGILPKYLRFGAENKITFEVDSRLHSYRTIPTKPKAYSKQNFGGIFRGVYLISEPEINIDDLDINYTLKQDLLNLNLGIKLKTFLSSSSRFLQDTISQKDVICSFKLSLDTQVVHFTPNLFEFVPEREQILLKDTTLEFSNIISWGPRYPVLYTLELALKQKHDGKLLDTIRFKTGFRNLALSNNTLNINGIPLALKGITVFEEQKSAGNVLTPQSILNDIKLAKGLGSNAIRFKEPPHPFWIQACDSLGLLCLIDFPNTNVPSEILVEKTYTENSELLLRDLLNLIKYSPSVIAIGLGTGFNIADNSAEPYIQSLSTLIKDNSSHFTFFSPKQFVESNLYDYADFVGLSFLDHPISESQEILKQALSAVPKEKPFLVTEYGSAPEPNNHNGYSDVYSLEYQAKTILDHYTMFKDANKKSKRLLGSFVYSLTDYHYQISPIRSTSYDDTYLATYGLTKLNRERKMSYEMVKSLYADERVYNPAIGKAPDDFSPSLILIATLLTAGLVFLLNENRRIRENMVRALIRPFHLFMDIRDQRITYPQDPLILITLLSLLWGSILSALLFSSYDAYLLEFWLSHFIRPSWLKESINYLIINPEISTFVFGLVFFGLSFLICSFLSLYLFIIGKAKTTYLQLMNLWSWVSVHWVFLIFIAAFIDRISNHTFTIIIFYICLVFLAFSFYRLFHGLSIVANLPQPNVQLTGFLFIVIVLACVYFIFDYYYQTSAYINYLNQTMLN